MYDLFSKPRRVYSGLLSDFVLKNVEARTLEDVNRVIEYHRYGSFFVPNTHLLVRLINTVSTPLAYELNHYYEVTIARSLYAANALKLTSSINYGQWHVGEFYFNCPELIIAYNGSDSPQELARGWMDLQPVRVLECPVSNMNYLLPNGVNHSSERGLVVIAIDLPMLMIQYRCFMEQQSAKAAKGLDNVDTTKHFVAKYVLPNMLRSQTDLALFNRLYNLEMGAPMGIATKRHPFHISDYTDQLDKNLMLFADRIRNTGRDYENYLEQLPRFFSDNPLSIPDILETRLVWWALFLARKRQMEFLIEVGGAKGIQMNRAELNVLKRIVKQFKSDRIYEKVLPDGMKLDMDYFFKRVNEI